MTDTLTTHGPTKRHLVTLAIVALLVIAGAVGWHELHRSAGSDASARSCSWNADIQAADPDQAGLIRCYLRAIAQHDVLRSVVRTPSNGGPTGFTTTDYAHTADAGAGSITAVVTPNDSDPADALVTIRYADGAHDIHELHLADPNSSHSWRFWDVGSYPENAKAPAPAKP